MGWAAVWGNDHTHRLPSQQPTTSPGCKKVVTSRRRAVLCQHVLLWTILAAHPQPRLQKGGTSGRRAVLCQPVLLWTILAAHPQPRLQKGAQAGGAHPPPSPSPRTHTHTRTHTRTRAAILHHGRPVLRTCNERGGTRPQLSRLAAAQHAAWAACRRTSMSTSSAQATESEHDSALLCDASSV